MEAAHRRSVLGLDWASDPSPAERPSGTGKLKKGGLCAFSEGNIQFASRWKQREELLGALVRRRQANWRSGGRGPQHSPAAPGDVHTPTTRHWEPSLQGLPRGSQLAGREFPGSPRGDPTLFPETWALQLPAGCSRCPTGEPGSPSLPPGQVRAGRTPSRVRAQSETEACRGQCWPGAQQTAVSRPVSWAPAGRGRGPLGKQAAGRELACPLCSAAATALSQPRPLAGSPRGPGPHGAGDPVLGFVPNTKHRTCDC